MAENFLKHTYKLLYFVFCICIVSVRKRSNLDIRILISKLSHIELLPAYYNIEIFIRSLGNRNAARSKVMNKDN